MLANGEVLDSPVVLATDERRDLAVLQVKAVNTPMLDLGDSNALTVGESLVILGSPRGLEGTVIAGILSSVRDIGDGYKVLQTDAAVNPGNSGGPVMNAEGVVVGVVTFQLRSSQGLNFAVLINYVRDLLNNLHELISLEQISKTITPRSAHNDSRETTLRETLEWLREKIPLGIITLSLFSVAILLR